MLAISEPLAQSVFIGSYDLTILQAMRCDTDKSLVATAACKAAVAIIAAALVLLRVRYVSVFDIGLLLA